MSVTTWQSNTIPLTISTNGGVTYKNVVCKRSFNFNGTSAVNSEETDCGIQKGLGAPDWTVDFEGVVNTQPDSATEISAKELLDLWTNQTLTYVKFIVGTGPGQLYVQGSGYVTDLGVQNAVGSLMAFSFTFNGIGVPDITA